jgi:hypothetical protein
MSPRHHACVNLLKSSTIHVLRHACCNVGYNAVCATTFIRLILPCWHLGLKAEAMMSNVNLGLSLCSAAMALRPFQAELGCLPVSKLCGLPNAAELLHDDGTPSSDPPHRMLKQLPAMLGQLEYIALAMLHQREASGLPQT